MNFRPFDICRFVVLPGRKLYGLFVEVEPRPGVFHKLLGLTAEVNATLIYASFSRTLETYRVIAFLDFTNATTDLKDIIEKIRAVENVKYAGIIEPVMEGFIADNISLPLVIGKERAVIFESSGFKYLIEKLREQFGSAGEAVLYYMGFNVGLGYGNNYKQIGSLLGIKTPREIIEKICIPIFQSIGFGLLEIIELKEKPLYVKARVYNNFECELSSKQQEKPFSHLIRGLLAGLITAIFEKDALAREIKCITIGNPYCEFEIIPKQD